MDRSVGAEVAQGDKKGMVWIGGLGEVGIRYASGGVVFTVFMNISHQLMIFRCVFRKQKRRM